MNRLKTKELVLIFIYLFAIVIANLLIFYFGPSISVITAFLFIGLDLTTRDFLHEIWTKNLFIKMFALILTGSALSAIFNIGSLNIAIASFVAFSSSSTVDFISYHLLRKNSKILKVNGSNLLSSLVDSIIFPILAFGFPILWSIIVLQFLAKTIGGFLWYFILSKTNERF